VCSSPNLVKQRGQLGHGDTTQRNYPSVVTGLAGRNIITGQLIAIVTSLAEKEIRIKKERKI
jgi:hypothetical protein